jgi:hypothetical protein
MKQDIKAKWISALRSGEYEQGKQALKLDHTFCCLGVLCDIHSKETGTEWKDGYYNESRSFLPRAVIYWAELEENPNIYYNTMSLSSLNDSGSTFLQIADLIEAQL